METIHTGEIPRGKPPRHRGTEAERRGMKLTQRRKDAKACARTLLIDTPPLHLWADAGSAELHSAVSQSCTLRPPESRKSVVMQDGADIIPPSAFPNPDPQRITNPRYGRFKICATFLDWLAFFTVNPGAGR